MSWEITKYKDYPEDVGKNQNRAENYLLEELTHDARYLDENLQSWKDKHGYDADLTDCHLRHWLRSSMLLGVELFINSLDEEAKEKFFELFADSSNKHFDDVRESELVNYPLGVFLREEFPEEMLKAGN